MNIRLFTMIPLAQTVALIAVLLAAASMYRDGSDLDGTIAAYVLYLVQLFDPIARFSEWLGEFRQGLAALGKVVGLLQADERRRRARLARSSSRATARSSCATSRFGYDGGRPRREGRLAARSMPASTSRSSA